MRIVDLVLCWIRVCTGSKKLCEPEACVCHAMPDSVLRIVQFECRLHRLFICTTGHLGGKA